MNANLEKMLNEQLNFEIYSAHIYLAMSGCANDKDLPGVASWFLVQYEEELFHAKKIFNYINSRGGRVNITGFKDPQNEWKDALELFEVSLAHEQEVTKRIYNLMDAAIEAKDHATKSFLQWFVDEQVEEEDTVRDIISKVKMLKNSSLYHLDKELGDRSFTEPTE